MKQLFFLSVIVFFMSSFGLAQSGSTIKTGKTSSPKTSSSHTSESGPYLHVEAGTKTQEPKSFEDQISSYNLTQVTQLLSSYQTKYDQSKDDNNSSPEYLSWKTDILDKIAKLTARKADITSNSGQ